MDAGCCAGGTALVCRDCRILGCVCSTGAHHCIQDASAALVHRECHRDHPNEGTLPKKMLFSAQESSGADVCRAV